jgi:hypothetical protein
LYDNNYSLLSFIIFANFFMSRYCELWIKDVAQRDLIFSVADRMGEIWKHSINALRRNGIRLNEEGPSYSNFFLTMIHRRKFTKRPSPRKDKWGGFGGNKFSTSPSQRET